MLVSINLMKKLQLEKELCTERLFEHREKSNGMRACVMRTYCLCKPFWIAKAAACISVIVQGLSYPLQHSVHLSRNECLKDF